MKTTFKIGDRVRSNIWGYTGTIIHYNTDLGHYHVKRDDKVQGSGRDGAWTVGDYDTDLKALVETSKPSKVRTFQPNTQNGMLLAHLLGGDTITRIKADHLYRIASLTRRIADLRDAGHKIEATVKVDPTGRPYTEYALRNAGRV